MISFQYMLESLADPQQRVEVVVGLQGRDVLQSEPLLCLLHVGGQRGGGRLRFSQHGLTHPLALHRHSAS